MQFHMQLKTASSMRSRPSCSTLPLDLAELPQASETRTSSSSKSSGRIFRSDPTIQAGNRIRMSRCGSVPPIKNTSVDQKSQLILEQISKAVSQQQSLTHDQLSLFTLLHITFYLSEFIVALWRNKLQQHSGCNLVARTAFWLYSAPVSDNSSPAEVVGGDRTDAFSSPD